MSAGTLGNTPRRIALSVRSAEPALDKVEPRTQGGREVEMEARMLGQPGLHVRVGVSAVVVDDQMHIEPSGHVAVDGLQEDQELAVAVTGQALAHHEPGN